MTTDITTTTEVNDSATIPTADPATTNRPRKGKRKAEKEADADDGPSLADLLSGVVQAVRDGETSGLNYRLDAGFYASEYVARWIGVHKITGRETAIGGIQHEIAKETGLTVDANRLIRVYQTFALLSPDLSDVRGDCESPRYALPYASVELFTKLVRRISSEDSLSEAWEFLPGAERGTRKLWEKAVKGDRVTKTRVMQYKTIRDAVDLILADIAGDMAEMGMIDAQRLTEEGEKATAPAEKARLTKAAEAATERANAQDERAEALREAVRVRNLSAEERKDELEAQGKGGKRPQAGPLTEDAYRAMLVDRAKESEAEALAQDIALMIGHAGKATAVVRRVMELIDWTGAGMVPALSSALVALPKIQRSNLLVMLAKAGLRCGAPEPTEGFAPVAAPVNRLPVEAVA